MTVTVVAVGGFFGVIEGLAAAGILFLNSDMKACPHNTPKKAHLHMLHAYNTRSTMICII